MVMGSWSCLRDQDYRMRLAAEETSGQLLPAKANPPFTRPLSEVRNRRNLSCIKSTVGTGDRNHLSRLFRVDISYEKLALSGRIYSVFALPMHHINHTSAETDSTSETNARSECIIPNEPSVHETNMCPPRLQTQSPAMRTEMYKA